MIQLPTGAGKTVIGGALIWSLLMDQPRAQAAWLTHRVELSAQTETRLRNDFSLKVESSSVHWNTDTPAPAVSGGVRLLQAQTVARRIAEPEPVWHAYGPEDLLIVDEAHHAAARGWETAISRWPGRVVGLTATPWRLSPTEGFDRIFDAMIGGPQIPELQREGHLAHSRTFTPPLEDRIIGGVAGVAGDFTEVGIERSNAPMVMTTKAIQYWERMARDRSTIVYAVSTGHAHNLVEEFAKTSVPVAVLLSETPADERESAIEGFRTGTIQVLVNVLVATEGFDLPDASCVVITRPTKSLALFLQMVGRGLRPKADGGDCLILDLTGISEIHGTPETVREWQLSARGETVHGDPPVIRCWRCGFMAHPTYHSCPRCDADMGRSCGRCGRSDSGNAGPNRTCARTCATTASPTSWPRWTLRRETTPTAGHNNTWRRRPRRPVVMNRPCSTCTTPPQVLRGTDGTVGRQIGLSPSGTGSRSIKQVGWWDWTSTATDWSARSRTWSAPSRSLPLWTSAATG